MFFQISTTITNLSGNSGRNFLFAFCVNSESIKVYEVADSESYGFDFSPIIVFPYENRLLFFRMKTIKPNLIDIAGEIFFFCIFVNSVSFKVFEGADIECYRIRSPRLCFSIFPRQ